MAEYIDKEAFIAHEKRQMHEIHDLGILCGAQGCLNDLKKFPAADVRERVPVENVMEYRPVKYDPDEFFNRKKTNADRIRAMSDEELAEWIYQETTNALNLLSFGNSKPPKSFFTWLDWLTQEADNDIDSIPIEYYEAGGI